MLIQRKRRLILGVAMFALLLIPAARLRSQGQSQQAIQRAIAAHGRSLTTGEVQDWTAEGKITYFTAAGPKGTFDMILLRKGPSQVQRIIKQGAHELRQGTNGDLTWDSLDGRFTTIAQGPTLQFLEAQTVRSVFAMMNAQGADMTFRDQGPSLKTRQIEAQDKRGRKTNFFMDEDSGLVTKLEFVSSFGTDPKTRRDVSLRDTTQFSDFRLVQGVMTPFKVERFSDGIKIEEVQFSSHRYNAALKDSAFKP